MRNFKILLSFCLTACVFITSCTKDGAGGSTIASQVTGTFMSSSATITVDNEVVVDAATDYTIRISEVDANTVSVISDHTKTFEVDLSKSDNGEVNIGTTDAGTADFTFVYRVADGTITIDYANSDVTMKFVGAKE